VPSFGANQRLARYIDPEFRQETRRAKPPAFMEEEGTTRDGLSVNSLEIHTENQIAAIYAEKFKEERPVALSTLSIEDYNRAAAEAGLSIQGYHADDPHWTHVGPKGDEPSYRHDPKIKNESHCLVSYTRLLNEVAEFRFAVRMARKPTFRLY
jgi:hypothetical protein